MYRFINRKKILTPVLFALAFFTQAPAFAQELLIKQLDSHTELFIKADSSAIKDVTQSGETVTVTFTKKLKAPFKSALQDKFIEYYEGSGNTLSVKFSPFADFAVFKDNQGIKIAAARHKEVDNLLMTYGMGAPMLQKAGKYADDPAAESMMAMAENLIQQQRYTEAVDVLKTITTGNYNQYYRQEGLFRLGELLMQMGATNPQAYIEASDAMDKLISSFPDSSRILQALKISAQAKELSGESIGAAKDYFKIYELSVDAETKRNSLEKIGTLYQEMGQYDKAMEAYNLYVANFMSGSEKIRSNMGKLYLLMNNKEDAYNFFKDLTVKDMQGTLDNELLMKAAEIFTEKGDKNKAIIIYEELLKTSDPSVAVDSQIDKNEIAYKLALLYKDTGDKKYESTLENLMYSEPDSLYGRMALADYATQHYKEKATDEWRQFLAPIYKFPDDSNNLWQKADLVIINALGNDGSIEEMNQHIDKYVKSYPTAPEISEIIQKKEDSTFELARKKQIEKNYPYALSLYQSFLSEFPASPKVPLIKQYMDDIYYDQALISYSSKNYTDTLDRIAQRMEQPDKISKRWYDLWEDASYFNIYENAGKINPSLTRYRCREYLVQSSQHKYNNEIKEILFESFKYPYFQAFEANENKAVIDMYNENIPWLDNYPDQEFVNNVKITAAKALLNLGLTSRARELFRSITPMMTSEYASLGYDLCENIFFDINKLSPDIFEKTAEDAERCGTDYVLPMIKKYTRDLNSSLKMEYMVSKNISDDRLREKLINELYNKISSDNGINFKGYEDIYLDKGMQEFKKKNYAGSLIPLKKYIDTVQEQTDKKSEALYYTGKSLININEKDKGFDFYRQLVNTMPDSVYKNMARSELEEDTWRKGLKK